MELIPKYITKEEVNYSEKSIAKDSLFIQKAITPTSLAFWFSLYKILGSDKSLVER